ncbi:MarR family winged helix-turn-helix transcriptional regulator [Alkalilacustris brevis]|uniref:MarR family winged helix-turn-helix transcriptional regulator n=1 Tax=Alkalilacustris brevis TaxID=2026338 RepID=UPI000E0D3025|nr:MarR family transcriptional regulator [Alkalilacustris brevis]
MSSSADHGAEIIVHLARLAHSGASDARLTPAQWTALRFFARANRLSRTPSAFSEFHATTRGTASQTVKSLVALGLLERHRNEDDGRSIRFELTPAGHEVLQQDPLKALARALEALPQPTRDTLFAALRQVACDLADDRQSPAFGTCADCAHCESTSEAPAFCRCAAATLGASDMGALCIEFSPRRQTRKDGEHLI